MALKTTLEDTQSRLDALLTYANSVTGADDVSVGDAIETLSNGYGQGGYSADEIAVWNIVGDIALTVGYVNDNAFYQNKITSVTADSVGRIGNNAFRNCRQLTSLKFTALGSVSASTNNQFTSCTGLTAIGSDAFPEITGTYPSMFNGCSNLQIAVFPKAKTFYNESFKSCSSLTTFDAGAKDTSTSAGTINSSCFTNDSVLSTVILRFPVVCSLANVNAFSGTPFANGGAGGEIYVPSALIDTYKASANWSTLNGYGTVTWKAIEGSIYEHAYADGTPIS